MRWLALFLLCTACMTGSMMTMNRYTEIQVGEPVATVEHSAGPPYQIRRRADGSLEYEYVEKINNGFRVLEQRRYILVVRAGKVVAKRVESSTLPPYELDSYDLQTTYGDEVSEGEKSGE